MLQEWNIYIKEFNKNIAYICFLVFCFCNVEITCLKQLQNNLCESITFVFVDYINVF